MAYVDYAFYTNSFLGNAIPQDAFLRMAERGSEYLDFVTFDRLQDDNSLVSDKVKRACCAIAELIYKYEQTSEGGDVQKVSEKVGEYSVQFAAATDSQGHVLNINDKKKALAKQYLGHTGLMYRGW